MSAYYNGSVDRDHDDSEVPAQIESKVLEIRDHGTFIGALAIRMLGANPIQEYYFRHCGYPADGSSIMLLILAGGKATNDPYEWGALRMGPRTMPVAHDFILRRFDSLSDGDVVDVAFILGETDKAKVSERLEGRAGARL